MPVISVFYGVTVLMYFFDNKRHHLPHIHVESGGDSAVVGIPNGDVVEGNLRRPQLRLVQAWVEIHKEELMRNWDKAITGESVSRIEPLK